MISIQMRCLPVLLLLLFTFSGCIRVNVKNINEQGHVTSDMNYYPLSNEKDFRRWKGITPLHIAAAYGDHSKISKLLKNGANPFAVAINPSNNAKITPLRIAYAVKDGESVYLLARYMLKNYKSYYKKHPKELEDVAASLWRFRPLATLDLLTKYNYSKLSDLSLQLLNKRTKNPIATARKIALKGYPYALRKYWSSCPKCVSEAFAAELYDIEHNWSLSNDVAKHIGALKYYKPYVSASKYKKALELQERYNADMARASQKFRNMLADAFKSNGNDTGGIQIKYQGYNKSNGNYVYNLKYNGSYDGQIFYYPNNGGYTIMTVGVKHGQSVNGNFANGRLYTPQCGHTNADNINDAIKKAVDCSYKRSY